MTYVPENLNHLASEFDILGCHDLASFFSRPSADLFKILRASKKDVLGDRERLIFYLFDQVDVASMEKLLNNLRNCLIDVDFPGFFLIIATDQMLPELPDPDISIISALPPKNYTPKIIAGSQGLLDPPATICALPWTSLNVTPQGKFGPCNYFRGAVIREDGTYFDPKKDSIKEVYNSAYMKNVRQAFRDGTRIKACTRCWKEEEDGLASKRQLHADRFGDAGRAINWEEDDIKNLQLLSISIGNQCTQRCRICVPTDSSSIAEDILSKVPVGMRGESNPYQILLKNGEWANNRHFWEEIDTYTQIRHFDFTGGEPLLDENHFRVLKSLIEKDLAKDITIHYSTSLCYLPETAIEIWKEFKHVDLSVSVDDIENRFDYQRYGKYSWVDLDRNIKKIKKEKTPNIFVSSYTMIHAMNVYYLPELCEWIDRTGFDDYHFSVLYNPPYYNISQMPSTLKILVLDRLRSENINKKFLPFINNAADIIKKSKDRDETILLLAIKELDRERQQDFSQSHHEVAKAIGYSI
jgi:MoaA/NifB/PqqE/SkfB family radical SAM enzyme